MIISQVVQEFKPDFRDGAVLFIGSGWMNISNLQKQEFAFEAAFCWYGGHHNIGISSSHTVIEKEVDEV